MAVRKLGQILVDLGTINDDQLEMLVEEQSQSRGLIGRIAVNMGLVNDEELIQALAEQFGLKAHDMEHMEAPTAEVREAVSNEMAQLYRVVPVQLHKGVLTLATCDPQNLAMQDELRRFLGHEIRLVVATEAQVLKSIDKFFNEDTDSIAKIIDDLQEDEDLKSATAKLGGDGPINLSDVPVTFTLNRSKTNSASALKPMVCLKKCHRRHVTLLSRSRRASK